MSNPPYPDSGFRSEAVRKMAIITRFVKIIRRIILSSTSVPTILIQRVIIAIEMRNKIETGAILTASAAGCVTLIIGKPNTTAESTGGNGCVMSV